MHRQGRCWVPWGQITRALILVLAMLEICHFIQCCYLVLLVHIADCCVRVIASDTYELVDLASPHA